MSVLRIVKRQGNHALYDAVIAEMDLNRRHPLGLIMHGASEVSPGQWEIAQVWESEEYARSFEEQELRPALEAVGAPLEGEVTFFELHHLVTPDPLARAEREAAPNAYHGRTCPSAGQR